MQYNFKMCIIHSYTHNYIAYVFSCFNNFDKPINSFTIVAKVKPFLSLKDCEKVINASVFRGLISVCM